MSRRLRILVLLFILATVALNEWRTDVRLTSWENTVHVGIYPVAADDSPVSARFVAALDDDQFAGIAEWMQQQSDRWGRSVLQPIALRVAPPLSARPPLPQQNGGVLDAVVWSLKMRWWASQHDDIDGPAPDIRLFVLFHDPERIAVLPHSTGLEQGRIGLVHTFASRAQRRQNAVVIAHELLHTFGATDKYDPATLQPRHPEGYAEPDRRPLLPQTAAEIMGGRIPVSEARAVIPAGLAEVVIGGRTAVEIGLAR
ncbi:MAG TPA: hypothetical protein PL143_15060 [Rhodocyclaceae bacterium]|nr:hypothetical protein [Rhodocyclaceae bacterium]